MKLGETVEDLVVEDLCRLLLEDLLIVDLGSYTKLGTSNARQRRNKFQQKWANKERKENPVNHGLFPLGFEFRLESCY